MDIDVLDIIGVLAEVVEMCLRFGGDRVEYRRWFVC